MLVQLASKQQKKRERCRAAWQEFIAAKRFKPKQEQCSSLMCRLAVGIEPPGGFWEKPRNFDKTVRKLTDYMQF